MSKKPNLKNAKESVATSKSIVSKTKTGLSALQSHTMVADATAVFSPQMWRDMMNRSSGSTDKRIRKILYFTIMAVALIILPLLYMIFYALVNPSFSSNIAQLQSVSYNINQQTQSLFSQNNSAAFDALRQQKSELQALSARIENRSMINFADYTQVETQLNTINENLDILIRNEEGIVKLNNLASNFSEHLPPMVEIYSELERVYESRGAAANDQKSIVKQTMLIERMRRYLHDVVLGSEDAFKSGTQMANDRVSYEELLFSLNPIDDSSRSSIQTLSNTYQKYIQSDVATILSSAVVINQSREAVRQIGRNVLDLQVALKDLDATTNSVWKSIIPMVLMVLGSLLLFYTLSRLRSVRQELIRREEAEKARQMQRENLEKQRQIERNDAAILRLMGELSDLADGDLTTNATVTEDFTGAIADAINFAIEQLRQLVQTINTTANKVFDSSANTQQITLQLTESSQQQAQEISMVSKSIRAMAESIDEVSRNAIQSAKVAERSADISVNGAEMVRRNVEGMDHIREQIQETAKRIKRLGESSQEIGNIVSLINDITDQTNILALNAAIQASMAGEAGRGFAVVADEVQRLAERSAFATKEIEGLVKTIQSDTHEAVASMEQTTAEVVRGARLSKEAGIALDEVQKVSKSLAELIQNISNAARQQAHSASQVAQTMQVIQDITSQNLDGTSNTAAAISELAMMTTSLKRSVQGFKLPDSD